MHINSHSYGRSRRRGLNSEINVTPFVDVMLVLLIIFMVTSPMLLSGVSVNLPETSNMPLSGQDEPIVVTVNKNGDLYLQESMLSIDLLETRLAAIVNINKDCRVFIRGDKDVSYGKMMEVFSALKVSGKYKVALVTESVAK